MKSSKGVGPSPGAGPLLAASGGRNTDQCSFNSPDPERADKQQQQDDHTAGGASSISPAGGGQLEA